MGEEKKLKRFGRYLLLDHLVDGGMAKICRARFLGDEADKIVAIKMIRPQFSENENFKQMFLDEIKVTFGLNHPNIAQTYDYGIYKEQLYAALELVDGKNLKQFMDALREKEFVSPVEISVYIISQVCQGLHYAHNFRDKLTDKKFNIIHRDISPHNIMISFDGAVKIIDFGIAKTEVDSEKTQAGTIKGKLSYLAPEYLAGADLDHRYDQFGVAVTLWELLCSRKLFKAKNEIAVLKQIQECKISPPSHINPNIPKELDAIIMKALSKNRDDRFSDIEQFNRALVKFLYAKYPDFNASDIAYFAKDLFKADIQRDRAKLFEFGKIDITPYINDWKKDSEGGSKESSIDNDSEGLDKIQIIDFDFGSDEKKGGGVELQIRPEEEEKGQSNWKSAYKRRKRKENHRKEKERNELKQVKMKKRKARKFVALGALACLAYMGVFKRKEILKMQFVQEIIQKPIIRHQLLKVFPELYNRTFDGVGRAITSGGKKVGSLKLKGFRNYHQLFINGKRTKYRSFGNSSTSLVLGKKYEIEVSQEGKKSFVRHFTLTKNNPSITYRVSTLADVDQGEIFIKSKNIPQGSLLKFKIGARQVKKEIPFNSYRIPAGEYQGVIENRLLGVRKKVKFNVKKDRRTQISIE